MIAKPEKQLQPIRAPSQSVQANGAEKSQLQA
jgi:hypothetical protein